MPLAADGVASVGGDALAIVSRAYALRSSSLPRSDRDMDDHVAPELEPSYFTRLHDTGHFAGVAAVRGEVPTPGKTVGGARRTRAPWVEVSSALGDVSPHFPPVLFRVPPAEIRIQRGELLEDRYQHFRAGLERLDLSAERKRGRVVRSSWGRYGRHLPSRRSLPLRLVLRRHSGPSLTTDESRGALRFRSNARFVSDFLREQIQQQRVGSGEKSPPHRRVVRRDFLLAPSRLVVTLRSSPRLTRLDAVKVQVLLAGLG